MAERNLDGGVHAWPPENILQEGRQLGGGEARVGWGNHGERRGAGGWRGGGGGRIGEIGRNQGGEGGRTMFGQKRMLPESIKRDLMKRKNIPYSVSLGFEEFKELPASLGLGKWLVQLKLSPSTGYGVKRICRSEPDHRFYLQLEDEGTVERFLAAVGEEGKEWKEKGGQIRIIKAKKEGDGWIEVKIVNIDPDTKEQQVYYYFSHVGETKEFKMDEVDGILMDSATIKVKVKEKTRIPAYLVVKGLPDQSDGVAVWQLDYEDRPLVCFRCYEQGHRRRDCRAPSVPISALLARPALTEGQGGVKGSYAQVVKSQDAVRLEEEAIENKRKEEENKRAAEEGRRAAEEAKREERKKEIELEKTKKEEDRTEEANLRKAQEAAAKRREFLEGNFKKLNDETRSLEKDEDLLHKRADELKMRKEKWSKHSSELCDQEEELNRKTSKKLKYAGREEEAREQKEKENEASTASNGSLN